MTYYGLSVVRRVLKADLGAVNMRLYFLVVVAAWLLFGLLAHGQSPDPQSQIRWPETKPLQLKHGKKLGAGPAKKNSGIVRSRQWPDVF